MFKKLALLCVVGILCLHAHGQSAALKPLSIGDTVPDLTLRKIINHKESVINISDFTGDLLILDFWSTWCVPCVKSLPKFQELQKQFDGRVDILLATKEPLEEITAFLDHRKITLPCVTEDSVLWKLFPHNAVPHEVWIKERKVIAITYAEAVTAENITKVLNGETVELPEKKFNQSYDRKEPLLGAGNGLVADDLLTYSIISKYTPGIFGYGSMRDNQGRYKLQCFNASVAQLYAAAAKYGDPFLAFENRLFVDVAEKGRVLPEGNPNTNLNARQDFYCYELIVPPDQEKQAPEFMIEDLNRYFGTTLGIKASIETISTTSWVLRRTGRSKSKPGPKAMSDNTKSYSNFADLFSSISYMNRKETYPIVDKTGISGAINITLPSGQLLIPELQKLLPAYGIDISLEVSEVKMLVIKNIN